jgi:hypothetical protein
MVFNPVRAATMSRPEHCRWNRDRATARIEKAPVLLTRDWVFAQFGTLQDRAERQYRKFVQAGTNAPSLIVRHLGVHYTAVSKIAHQQAARG